MKLIKSKEIESIHGKFHLEAEYEFPKLRIILMKGNDYVGSMTINILSFVRGLSFLFRRK